MDDNNLDALVMPQLAAPVPLLDSSTRASAARRAVA